MEGTTRVLDAGGRCGADRVQVGAVLDSDLAKRLREYAERDGRSVSNAIAQLLRRALAESTAPVGSVWDKSEVR